jgi:DNA polymerase III delta prime subunit
MPVEAPVRSFVIQTQQILGEAQNALLKLFEEPSAYVVFYLVLPSDDMLLPTLRSRLMVYAVEGGRDDSNVCASFLALTYAERLDLIAKMLKSEDAEWIQNLVQGLSEYAHTSQNPEVLRDVLMLEKYIYTNGASKKMLLEHIALSV